MKKVLKPISICVAVLLALGCIVTAVIFFIPRDNTSFSFECFLLRRAVSDFLKDVEKERYGDAFDRVYCVSAEDGTSIEASDSCRQAWIDRASSLRTEDNTYLKGYSDLKVRKEKGEFTVTVTLSVTRQGYNDPFYSNGNTFTVIYDDGWKIQSISSYEPALQTDFEKALSGRFTAEERTEKAA